MILIDTMMNWFLLVSWGTKIVQIKEITGQRGKFTEIYHYLLSE